MIQISCEQCQSPPMAVLSGKPAEASLQPGGFEEELNEVMKEGLTGNNDGNATLNPADAGSQLIAADTAPDQMAQEVQAAGEELNAQSMDQKIAIQNGNEGEQENVPLTISMEEVNGDLEKAACVESSSGSAAATETDAADPKVLSDTESTALQAQLSGSAEGQLAPVDTSKDESAEESSCGTVKTHSTKKGKSSSGEVDKSKSEVSTEIPAPVNGMAYQAQAVAAPSFDVDPQEKDQNGETGTEEVSSVVGATSNTDKSTISAAQSTLLPAAFSAEDLLRANMGLSGSDEDTVKTAPEINTEGSDLQTQDAVTPTSAGKALQTPDMPGVKQGKGLPENESADFEKAGNAAVKEASSGQDLNSEGSSKTSESVPGNPRAASTQSVSPEISQLTSFEKLNGIESKVNTDLNTAAPQNLGEGTVQNVSAKSTLADNSNLAQDQNSGTKNSSGPETKNSASRSQQTAADKSAEAFEVDPSKSGAPVSIGQSTTASNSNAVKANDVLPEHIQQIVQETAFSLKAEKSSLHLQLNPQDLGTIDIHFSSDEKGVGITIMTEHASTGRLLESQIDTLRQSLNDAGLNLSHIDFGMKGQSGQNGQSQPQFNQQDQSQIVRNLFQRQWNGESTETSSSFSQRLSLTPSSIDYLV